MRVLELRDAPSPAEACERFLDLPRCALLESVPAAGVRWPGGLDRYSFLTADPFIRLEAKGRRLTWSGPDGVRSAEGDPFPALDAELARWRGSSASEPLLPPFRGGALGYFAYDLLHHLERVPAPRYDDLGLPDLDVGFYDWVVAWDHVRGRAWIFSTGFPAPEGPERDSRATQRLDQVLARLAGSPRRDEEPSGVLSPERGSSSSLGRSRERSEHQPRNPSRAHDLRRPQRRSMAGTRLAVVPPATPAFPLPDAPNLSSTFSRAGYMAAVARAREYVLAGDIFQVNVSQRLSLPCPDPPFELYRRMRAANPAPFAAFLAGREAHVLSVSPERFLRLSGGYVETRPIKGTTGRGYTPEHDFALGDDLVASEKDRAENVMIVDLLRNDLSRVALDESIRVPDLWRVESHPTVHHLVSTVTARLRPDVTAIDLLRATFPGGSITGAPKVRAMEIIHELEPTRRNVYCGSIGYLGFEGEVDLSIAIRTLILKDGIGYFSVGGAVVADSDPAAEYRETLLKAAGLLRAWEAPLAAEVGSMARRA